MKRRFLHLAALAIYSFGAIVGTWFVQMAPVSAAFNGNLLIDDVIFSDITSMSPSTIDSWLNIFTNSCISPNSGFTARLPSGYSPSGGFTYGNYATAGNVIHTAANVFGINPQVLLVTLEKEQSLVTGRNSATYCNDGNHKYAAAVGYGCPDSGTSYNYTGLDLYRRNGVTQSSVGPTCVNSSAKAGFSQQVIRAAWLLKFGQQRSLGNTSWAVIMGSWNNSDDLTTCYSGPMTQGNHKRCPNDASTTFYDGYTTIDATPTHMDTGATAALYWYTPHFHGNQNFVTLFNNWFGGTVSASYYSCHNSANIGAASTGTTVLPNKLSKGTTDRFSVALMNNTGSTCTEIHVWNYGQQSWYSNTATNLNAFNPADGDIVSADIDGDGKDELMLVAYRNTGSGKVEIHRWLPNYQQWALQTATNHPAVDPADVRVIAADLNGDGKDELQLIKYRNTDSSKIEVHTWSQDYQGWTAHIATNHIAVDPADVRVIAADLNGDGKDELQLIKYRNTDSSKVEVHTWSQNLQTWTSHIATNHVSVDPADVQIIASAFASPGRDNISMVKLRNTGSGKIEIHTWSSDEQNWISHNATNVDDLN